MQSNIKKTHPMVLVAATALTIFSLVGSAAITGLIPVAHTYRPDLAQELITDPNAAMVISNTLNQAKERSPRENGASLGTCADCGIVVSIRSFENKMKNYQVSEKTSEATYLIKIKMGNGLLHTITQYSTPRYSVGDNVRLKSGRLVSA